MSNILHFYREVLVTHRRFAPPSGQSRMMSQGVSTDMERTTLGAPAMIRCASHVPTYNPYITHLYIYIYMSIYECGYSLIFHMCVYIYGGTHLLSGMHPQVVDQTSISNGSIFREIRFKWIKHRNWIKLMIFVDVLSPNTVDLMAHYGPKIKQQNDLWACLRMG